MRKGASGIEILKHAYEHLGIRYAEAVILNDFMEQIALTWARNILAAASWEITK